MSLSAQDRLVIRHFLEDLEVLEVNSSGIGIKASTLRQTATPILRRWLIEGVLDQVLRHVPRKVLIPVEDLRGFYAACASGQVWFFAGVRAMIGKVPISNFGFGDETIEFALPYESEIRADLKLSDFKKQRVLFERGVWATRTDIIRYVANKWCGVHSDARLDSSTMKMIDHARYYYGFKMLEGGESIQLTVNHDGAFQIQTRSMPNDVLDVALLSILNTAQALCSGLAPSKADLAAC